MPLPADDGAGRLARIRAVFQQLPLTLGVALANAVLAGVVMFPVVRTGWLLAWLGAYALQTAVRLAWWLNNRRTAPDKIAGARWERVSIGGALASGALWGVMSTVLMPATEPYRLFVAFVIGGLCAGTATVNSPHPRTVAAFVFPAVLPMAVWFAVQGTRLDSVMAAMTLIFAVAMASIAKRYGMFFELNARMRMDLAARTAALTQANERLLAEMHERQATEAALRHSQKMEAIGNLTAGVAHDINNVLMAISGSAELLTRRLDPDTRHKSLLAAIFRATDRGSRLTRHLLAFARKEVLRPTLVDLNGVVHALSTLLEATLGKSIRIELSLCRAAWPVYVDRNEIERALVNLAINARDAMPDGGTLTLGTANVAEPPAEPDEPPLGPCVEIVVRDTGVGMSPDVLERAFDPFFTTKAVGQGTGLGLSQVYGLVKQSGGATLIDSTPGQGTVVRLYLPRAPAGAGAAAETVAAVADAPPTRGTELAAAKGESGAHVVVLDDEAEVARVVADLLRQAGYRVSDCATAAEALTYLEHDPTVAALVTDLGMPDCGGDEVARRARVARPGLPVVFITGYNDAAMLATETWQLRKPFGEAELVAILGRALAAATERA